MSGGDRKGTFKVEFLKEVERKPQQKWEEMKVYEMDAPDQGEGTPGDAFNTGYIIYLDYDVEKLSSFKVAKMVIFML